MSEAVAALVAVTEEAEAALGGVREVRLTHFPFHVGRERRATDDDLEYAFGEDRRQSNNNNGLNELYVVEAAKGHWLHVSAEHFAIERVDDRFFLVDRGSACGTIVAGRRIGGNRRGGRTELHDGDEVVVGTHRSRYIFRFAIV